MPKKSRVNFVKFASLFVILYCQSLRLYAQNGDDTYRVKKNT